MRERLPEVDDLDSLPDEHRCSRVHRVEARQRHTAHAMWDSVAMHRRYRALGESLKRQRVYFTICASRKFAPSRPCARIQATTSNETSQRESRETRLE